jgi:hypothetical protein
MVLVLTTLPPKAAMTRKIQKIVTQQHQPLSNQKKRRKKNNTLPQKEKQPRKNFMTIWDHHLHLKN